MINTKVALDDMVESGIWVLGFNPDNDRRFRRAVR